MCCWVFLFMATLVAAVQPAWAQERRGQDLSLETAGGAPGSPSAVASSRFLAPTGAHTDYQLYVHGLRVGRIEAGLDLQAAKYRIEVAFRTFGLIGWLFRGHQLDTAEGRFGRQFPEPVRFSGQGFWRGDPRRVLIDYVGNRPVVRDLQPPNDDEREPVPQDLQVNTVDTLSAMVALIRQVADTGRCDTSVETFDGRRAVQFNARTVGEVELEPTGRSTFQGWALRCDIDGRLLAGYRLEDPPEARGKSRHGTAWLASVVPGAPLLPVRVEFETTFFGDATAYLIGAGPGAARSPPAE